MSRYQYIKSKGALQEAMVQQQAAAPPASRAMAGMPRADFEEASITANLSVDALTRAGGAAPAMRVRRPAAGAPGSGLDHNQDWGRATGWWYVVNEGQRVMLIDGQGRMDMVEGPAKVWRWGKRLKPLDHYVAHPGDFLIVRYRDGRQEHLVGPTHFWHDPRQHLSVRREEVVQIEGNEAIVVYAEEGEGQISRRVVKGPGNFVPKPGEWLHTFSWHGTVNGQKVPHALVFQKLWLMPDQMYHDIAEVRTADDAELTVKLMIFFELVDVERLLATSHDPIGDFVNAATSDVVDFLGRYSFEAFKQNTEQLNELSTYRQLLSRAEQCGYRINKVVYRGYGAPPALQAMHDEASRARTKLQLEKATEQQSQELNDLKQEKALARAHREREARRAELQHRLDLERREAEARSARETAAQAAAREQARLDAEQARELAAAEDARARAHLSGLGELGVDLTAYLTQGRPDQVIELRGGHGQPHVHLPPSAAPSG
ncbi:MAG: hypothetical protein H6741_25365 [Alphaproteobacteria bacterium]|nr:hypothetical protein [Alphaproteobacteria bacterium]